MNNLKLVSCIIVFLFFATINNVYSQQIRKITLSPELSNSSQTTASSNTTNDTATQKTQTMQSTSKNNTQTIVIKPTLTKATIAKSTMPTKANPTTAQTELKPYYTNWSTTEAYNKVNEIGDRLVEANGIYKNVNFSVVNTEVVNATTNQNHEIKVYKGLLQYVEQEDELAAVIGHELGHVTGNDVSQKIGRAYMKQGAKTAGDLMYSYGGNSTLRTLGKLTSIGSDIGGDMINKKVDRNDEYGADKASVDILVKAGYNPLAEISILNKICGNYFDFMSDHPSGEKRIISIYNYINQKYPEYIEMGYPTVSYKRALRIINNSVAYK